jgi:ubiquinone/menaquinone biosynthesis C-methylase UbiE
LEVGDATQLRFENSTFDFVYSYHALEHIDNPIKALMEIKRVLKENGEYFIGTPNRLRLIGYLGSKNATLNQKIIWNISDWKAKFGSKFKNEYGAHAGFSAKELENLLKNIFTNNTDVSDIYYLKIYHKKKMFVKLLTNSYLSQIAYPGVYFMGSP